MLQRTPNAEPTTEMQRQTGCGRWQPSAPEWERQLPVLAAYAGRQGRQRQCSGVRCCRAAATASCCLPHVDASLCHCTHRGCIPCASGGRHHNAAPELGTARRHVLTACWLAAMRCLGAAGSDGIGVICFAELPGDRCDQAQLREPCALQPWAGQDPGCTAPQAPVCRCTPGAGGS